MIQLQGDQRTKIKEFLTDKENGLGLDDKTIKVCSIYTVTTHRDSTLTDTRQVHGF